MPAISTIPHRRSQIHYKWEPNDVAELVEAYPSTPEEAEELGYSLAKGTVVQITSDKPRETEIRVAPVTSADGEILTGVTFAWVPLHLLVPFECSWDVIERKMEAVESPLITPEIPVNLRWATAAFEVTQDLDAMELLHLISENTMDRQMRVGLSTLDLELKDSVLEVMRRSVRYEAWRRKARGAWPRQMVFIKQRLFHGTKSELEHLEYGKETGYDKVQPIGA